MDDRLAVFTGKHTNQKMQERNHKGEEVITVEMLVNGEQNIIIPKDLNAGLMMRVRACEEFIRGASIKFRKMGHKNVTYNIQLHDERPSKPSFLIDADAEEEPDNLPLIQDFYFMQSKGYETLRSGFEKLPKWNERMQMAIWRGSSTGKGELTMQTIKSLPRYLLCLHSIKQDGYLDARFNAVVQTKSEIEEHAIISHLQNLGLMRPRMQPGTMALHKWIVDIDGNVNSWGVLWKFLSGSCILRVDSQRQQWYYKELRPWKTHVPIEKDLSDMIEKIKWCSNNQLKCEEIANRGKQMAENVVRNISQNQDRAVEIYVRKYI